MQQARCLSGRHRPHGRRARWPLPRPATPRASSTPSPWPGSCAPRKSRRCWPSRWARRAIAWRPLSTAAALWSVIFPARCSATRFFTAPNPGRELDKLAECGTATQPAQAIDGVLLSDAVANFECRLDGRLEAGDHVIFTGQVVAAHVNADPRVRMLFCPGPKPHGGGANPFSPDACPRGIGP